MLCLSMVPGDYLTVGDDVVIQMDRMAGDRCKLVIHAPREIPVVRGEVLERNGGKRPACVFDAPRWRSPEITWNRSKAQALTAARAVLSRMDGEDSDVQALRRLLEHMFPSEQSEETTPLVSNG